LLQGLKGDRRPCQRFTTLTEKKYNLNIARIDSKRVVLLTVCSCRG